MLAMIYILIACTGPTIESRSLRHLLIAMHPGVISATLEAQPTSILFSTEFRRNRALGEMALCSDPINVKLFFGHCAT
jgi:hypothetical protein